MLLLLLGRKGGKKGARACPTGGPGGSRFILDARARSRKCSVFSLSRYLFFFLSIKSVGDLQNLVTIGSDSDSLRFNELERFLSKFDNQFTKWIVPLLMKLCDVLFMSMLMSKVDIFSSAYFSWFLSELKLEKKSIQYVF